MERGLYIATTGLLHNQRRMDAISNNMANVNTTSYKRDDIVAESFPDLLLKRIKDSSFNLTAAPEQPTEVKFTKAETENVYTLEIDKAFLRVETPFGNSHNKTLQFTVDNDGYLKTFYRMNGEIKTNNENYVLGQNGRIQIPDGQNAELAVDEQGNLSANGTNVDNLVYLADKNVIGTINSGVREDKVVTSYLQGHLMDTGNALDLALNGEGFFKVRTDKGDIYTRDGSLAIDENGELVTRDGNYVVGSQGSIISDTDGLTINEFGELIINGNVIDRLEVVDIANKEDLRKIGNNYYEVVEGQEAEETAFKGKVVQGYLEGSNVNSVREMVEMISIMRSYETSQKVVKSFDEMLSKVINEVPKL